MDPHQVVITGIGALTPVGTTITETWDALKAGTSGLGPVTLFDPSRIGCEVAAEVKGFDAEDRFGRREARKMDRVVALSLAAAREAWENAGAPAIDPSRGGVVFGTAVGGMQTVIEQAAILAERPDRLSPHFLPNFLVDTPTSYIATDLELRGPNFAVVSACATGAHAIGVATEMLRRGEADVILAGGADAGVIEVLLAGFTVMKALGKPRPGEPVTTASRPFDVTRDGFVIGEGAVVLVLERLADAVRRGAEPIAEVVGYGASNDAYHIAAPHPEGIGVIEMMRAALDRAGLEPERISYVNAHGTSTPLNDPAETAAIHAVFGKHASRLPVSSTKSMTGHLLGAAGALETAVCALALRDGIVPPTINLREPDPLCDLDYVSEGARRIDDLEYALSNSMGLGGHNGCTLLKRLEQ
ncbi:MAG: 3-oxoacyl-[acyl-carrier-protein] synthase [Gaiellaceae bacterium]|nr:3-oxoacyl-[acyl-carrier-protein] synthase [Gaiellaceae bacterium]